MEPFGKRGCFGDGVFVLEDGGVVRTGLGGEFCGDVLDEYGFVCEGGGFVCVFPPLLFGIGVGVAWNAFFGGFGYSCCCCCCCCAR